MHDDNSILRNPELWLAALVGCGPAFNNCRTDDHIAGPTIDPRTAKKRVSQA